VYELATFCNLNEQELDKKLILLSIAWPSVSSPLKQKSLDADEERWFTDFDCLEVRVSKPEDRATVLEAIRLKWGSPDEKFLDGEDQFNEFVRRKLPAIFRRSKQRYSGQLSRTMGEAFELAFGG